MAFVHGLNTTFIKLEMQLKTIFMYWARQGRRQGPQLVIIRRLLSERSLIFPDSLKMLVFFIFVTLPFVFSTSEGNALKTFLRRSKFTALKKIL